MALKIKTSAIKNEADITSNNILQLKANPVSGDFDAEHLKEINRRVLDGIPSYHGGEYRRNTGEHVRSRSVNDGSDTYVVHYKNDGVQDKDINDAIKKIGNIKELKSLDKDTFSKKLSTLYGDLDHIHPFTEANSRTLRIFTEQIANEAGRKLDWPSTNLNKNARDELYKARDLEVSKRTYPNLTIDSMKNASMSQIEAYETQKYLKDTKPLAEVMHENIDRPMKVKLNNDNVYQEKIVGAGNPYAAGKAQVVETKTALQPSQKQAASSKATIENGKSSGMSKGRR